MIKEFKLIRVDCDCCGAYYPSTKDPVHFQDEDAANKTVFEEGWKLIGKSHYCPSCLKVCRDAGISVETMYAQKTVKDGS
jgi:hypothetical protein